MSIDQSGVLGGDQPNENEIQDEKTRKRSYKEYFFDLETLIGEIHGKMNLVIATNEQTFLESYRGHMKTVVKDLDAFKRKLNEKEFLMRRDR